MNYAPIQAGMPRGGTIGQQLTKKSNADYHSEWTDIRAAPVTSIFGRTGNIQPKESDYAAFYVSLNGSYSDPTWLTALDWSKILNAPPGYSAVTSIFGRTGDVVGATGDYYAAQIQNAVDATQTYDDPAWLNTLAWAKITGAPDFATLYEPALGNPAADGYVLTSTAAGVRSWQESLPGGGSALAAWPVGSIFITITTTDPATLLGGGTWVRFGEGKMLVGQSATETEFDTAEETGGAKTVTLTEANLPAHAHSISHAHANATAGSAGAHTHTPSIGTFRCYVGTGGSGASAGAGAEFAQVGNTNSAGAHTHSVPIPAFSGNSGSIGSGAAVNKLPPYIVVYMWKRTA